MNIYDDENPILSAHDQAILDAVEKEERQTNRELRWCFPCHRKSIHRDNLDFMGLEGMHCLGCLHREWKARNIPEDG